MISVTSKSRYAVVAMAELARSGERPVPIAQIAERRGMPVQFLEQLFSTLRRDGLLSSQRGVKGGYTLARPPEQITVLEVVQALDGKVGAGGQRGRRDLGGGRRGAARRLPPHDDRRHRPPRGRRGRRGHVPHLVPPTRTSLSVRDTQGIVRSLLSSGSTDWAGGGRAGGGGGGSVAAITPGGSEDHRALLGWNETARSHACNGSTRGGRGKLIFGRVRHGRREDRPSARAAVAPRLGLVQETIRSVRGRAQHEELGGDVGIEMIGAQKGDNAATKRLLDQPRRLRRMTSPVGTRRSPPTPPAATTSRPAVTRSSRTPPATTTSGRDRAPLSRLARSSAPGVLARWPPRVPLAAPFRVRARSTTAAVLSGLRHPARPRRYRP